MADKQILGKFTQANTRQKGIIIALVIVMLVLIWQLMDLFKTPSPPSVPVKTPPASTTPTTANNNNNAGLPMNNNNNDNNAGANNAPLDTPDLSRGRVTDDPAFIKMQRATEEKYIGKLNELEELRIQRQIAETNQAISAAKLATVTAEKDISDLLTKPAPPQVPASAYAAQLVNPTTSANGAGTQNPQELSPPTSVATGIADYSLISVSMQLQKWSAVLGFQGKLFNITIGDSLPPDHSVVVSINKNSVILKKGEETRKITIVNSI